MGGALRTPDHTPAAGLQLPPSDHSGTKSEQPVPPFGLRAAPAVAGAVHHRHRHPAAGASGDDGAGAYRHRGPAAGAGNDEVAGAVGRNPRRAVAVAYRRTAERQRQP